MLAILYSIVSFEKILTNRSILWHTDNVSAAHITKVGSNNSRLQQIAQKIYFLCKSSRIRLTVIWIARENNTRADEISKSIDYDDWQTTQLLFNYLSDLWGPFSIDLFSDDANHKCTRFCSRFYSKNAFKIDAFSFDWSKEHSYIVPPVHLITRVIKHFLASKGNPTGVLIIPYWPSALYWPFLVNSDKSFKHFIKDYFSIPSSKTVLSDGPSQRSILNKFDVTLFVLLIKKINHLLFYRSKYRELYIVTNQGT